MIIEENQKSPLEGEIKRRPILYSHFAVGVFFTKNIAFLACSFNNS